MSEPMNVDVTPIALQATDAIQLVTNYNEVADSVTAKEAIRLFNSALRSLVLLRIAFERVGLHGDLQNSTSDRSDSLQGVREAADSLLEATKEAKKPDNRGHLAIPFRDPATRFHFPAHATDSLRLWTGRLERTATESENPYSSPSTHARDEWIYDHWGEMLFTDLSSELTIECEKQGWRAITSRAAVKEAARRYAEYHELPFPKSDPVSDSP